MVKLEGVDLQGERCSGVETVAKTHPAVSTATQLPTDILILGEHRFVVLSENKQTQTQTRDEGRMALVEKNTNGRELDVMGIDQALARMEESGSGSGSRFQGRGN